jgi:hypothetical protein
LRGILKQGAELKNGQRGILKQGAELKNGQRGMSKLVRFGKKVKMVFESEVGRSKFVATVRERSLA